MKAIRNTIRPKMRLILAACMALAVLGLSIAVPLSAAADHQPNHGGGGGGGGGGNTGDTKLLQAGTLEEIESNDPHLEGCDFVIQWTGFTNQTSVTFTLFGSPPTGDDSDVVYDDTTRTLVNGFAQYAIQFNPTNLGSMTPSSQGYHITMIGDVTDPDANGKNKTFWVETACGLNPPSPSPTPTPTPTPTTTPSDDPTPTPTPTTTPSDDPTPTPTPTTTPTQPVIPPPPPPPPPVVVDDNGTLIVEKQTLPDGATQTFSFSGAVSATLGDGQSSARSVDPGTYTVTEATADGWSLTSITCTDSNTTGQASTGDLATSTATFRVSANETVRCVFTNTENEVLPEPPITPEEPEEEEEPKPTPEEEDEVLPKQVKSGALPFTGSDPYGLVTLAGLLITSGGSLVLINRRKKH